MLNPKQENLLLRWSLDEYFILNAEDADMLAFYDQLLNTLELNPSIQMIDVSCSHNCDGHLFLGDVISSMDDRRHDLRTFYLECLELA